MADIERELDWNDEINRENGEFILLPAGDYNYTIKGYERARYGGSDKLPPCNKAVLKVHISATEGEVTLTHNLFLHTRTEGLLSEFFTSIGQKKPGEPLRMNWNTVPGSKGRLKIGIRTYTNKNGEERKANEIKKFYPKAGKCFEAGKF